MSTTALTEKFSSGRARVGEYCGAETALSFGDTRAELDALRSGCGVYDLGWRSKVIVSGKDRIRWLNGMITNNIRDLQEGRGNYSFLLTPQGRIQGDVYVYNRGDYLILGSERFQTPAILDRLRKYIIMDKVELEDMSDRLTAIGVQGPKTPEVLRAAGLGAPEVEPMQIADFTWGNIGLTITRMADEKFITYELWMAAENSSTVWDALVAAGATPVGMDALEMFRVAAGIPRYGHDISERDLPQETGQEQALNFNKGCYVGQEIVERIRARGNVHRTFSGFVIEGAVPHPRTRIVADGKEVGEISSALAVPSGTGERILGLGIIRREAAKPGMLVQIGDSKATVADTPFPEAFGESPGAPD
ncbi:MAG TPA: glycine cleavage T C-terminal barrel domain-containing protein [Terriglobales bacterium]|nr:glycine cleavage T C-terminal barrel domain-containing protein [Terriglobales bacterium]